ncbi:MAG: TolB family protein [Phycisphaerae bacterium]
MSLIAVSSILLISTSVAHAQGLGNGRIAISDRDNQNLAQIFTILPDGSDRQQLTTQGENLYPAWSPEGTQLAFASTRTGNSEVWIMNADGSNQTQLTFNTPGGNFTPEWSRDGARIAYASLLDTVGHPEVWVMNADGTSQQRLTVTPPNPGMPTWSLLPSWSPDDTHIVYASTITGSTQLWMMNDNGTNPIQLTNGNGPDYPDSNAPAWSRDGVAIVFWSGFENMFGEVWVMQPDGMNPQQLTVTTDPFNSDNPEWSPDRTRIIFDTNRSGPGQVEIWMMDADGANPHFLTNGFGQSSWQPIPFTNPIPVASGYGLFAMALSMLFIGTIILTRRANRSPHPS